MPSAYRASRLKRFMEIREAVVEVGTYVLELESPASQMQILRQLRHIDGYLDQIEKQLRGAAGRKRKRYAGTPVVLKQA